ncbi:MAG TPA: molybdopterin-dependent oxidoreductase [Nitrososphaeraceae archaeon]|nr:molybdopterin-dependent oxidoreductase [Nitrososphaeraceae archaeon]
MSQTSGPPITKKRLFTAGLVGGAIALAISLLMRLLAGGLFLPEIASQTLFSLTPGQIESRAVETLGPLAKYSALVGAVIANIILYGLISLLPLSSALYRRLRSNGYIRNAIQSSILSYIIVFLVGVLLFALVEANVQTKVSSIGMLSIYLILPNIVFGFVLCSFFYGKMLPSGRQRPMISSKEQHTGGTTPSSPTNRQTEIRYTRKQFLRAGVALAVAIPILYFGLGSLVSPRQEVQRSTSSLLSQFLKRSAESKPAGFENPRLTPLLASEITPTDLFYRIDKNPIVPVIMASAWKLNVKGLVAKPTQLSYTELRNMSSIEEFATLECVSNKLDGDLISTAVWKGVRLKDILEKAEISLRAKYIVFRCYDGYDVGIPIERGLSEGTILAYDMNGASLTAEHGYPVRAIVPGLYGMMNPKWITEIELVDGIYEGYWQRKGWANNARYNTHAFIVIPGNAAVGKRFINVASASSATTNPSSSETVSIGGMAFAGDRGISRVEVSTDGGNTWKDARLKDALSPFTWVLWTVDVPMAGNNHYKIIARATDKTGKIQTSEIADPFPNGATGYPVIDV